MIERAGKSVWILAKIDTGNALKEPFSHFPVLVAEYQKIEPIVPKELIPALFINKKSYSTNISTKIRMIPFHAVGGQGILPAFQPDRATILTENSKIELKDLYIAVYRQKLSDTFQALINPEMLSQGIQIKTRGKTRWIRG